MVLKATGEIEGIEGRYQRLYVPTRLSTDSVYPFTPGSGVRLQLVETTCDRQVLVVCPDVLEVDQELTDLELSRSSSEVQTSLEDVETEAGR